MNLITLGPKGTFSHQVALDYCKKAKIQFADSIDGVFFRLGDKESNQALVPLKNNRSGYVEETVVNLMKYDFSLQGKFDAKISHCLAGRGKIDEATALFAHPHAYLQCKDKLDSLGVDCRVVETKSNGHSAMQLKFDQSTRSLAIIPPLAAEIYKLPIIEKSIEDDPENRTTFFLIGKEVHKPTGKDTSAFLLFSDSLKAVENQIRTLIEEKKEKLMTLENLLLQEGHTPLYFMEMSGHVQNEQVASIVDALNKKFLLKHLGSYPA